MFCLCEKKAYFVVLSFKAQKVVDGTKGFESKFKVEIMNKTVNESGIMTNDENVIHID